MENNEKIKWHRLAVDQLLEKLATDRVNGLSEMEAAARLKRYGPNLLSEHSGRGALQILWEQFSATMSLILLAAALVSTLIGSLQDAAAISLIVVMFALLGFMQDYRAEKGIAALKRLAVPLARVRRGGRLQEVPATELVPGDILLLEAGNLAPADCRLIESHQVKVQESLLTGESEAVCKHSDPLAGGDPPLAERFNMLFMGTAISTGRLVGVVTATGSDTELGKIATVLQGVEPHFTPLQQRLDRLGKSLAVISVAIAGLIFLLGVARGERLQDMLLLAVSVAVAAIPEGLPAVVTITLALGAQRMLRRQALIRRLPAVETLGSVTVICSDKTGTLTMNRMTVTGITGVDELLDSANHGCPSEVGKVQQDRFLLTIATLCNDTVMHVEDGETGLIGDPTETALVSAAISAGIDPAELLQRLPRVDEIPFDSVSRRMVTMHNVKDGGVQGLQRILPPGSGHLLAAKGGIDSLLEVCSSVWLDNQVTRLEPSHISEISTAVDGISSRGGRLLAVAFRAIPAGDMLDISGSSGSFCLAGVITLMDPPRLEVAASVARCRSAGIRPVMITGDHPLTALAVAEKVGIDTTGGSMSGVELDRLTDQQLCQVVKGVSVFARVTPEHKLKIVEALRGGGDVVAMTGDGVNDAPALKTADVGVAMGKGGTDVARESSDIVLLDDNFTTIVAAVEEGRNIYDNIRKFVLFSVAGNLGKIMTVLVLPFLGTGIPLTPLQLLWLNLLTDGLLGLALGVEKGEPDIMQRPPVRGDSQIFDSRGVRYVVFSGGLIGALSMLTAWSVWQAGGPWRTVLFATLALAQVAQAVGLRSLRSSVFCIGLFSNPLLLVMVALVLVLQGLVIWLPSLQPFFKTVPLSPDLLAITFIPALLLFVLLELWKWADRRYALL